MRVVRVLVVAAAVALTACTSPAPVTSTPTAPRVEANPSGVTLDGTPWWPAGLNAYQLATDWSVNIGCGAMVDLDSFFASLPPHSLTRFNAFDSLATNRVTGEYDFGPIDRVFQAAERHGQLVLPVLSAWDGACADEVFKTRDWYADGWRAPRRANGSAAAERGFTPTTSYEQWVRIAVDRWKDSPALAMWETIGEPEPLLSRDGPCAPDGHQVLRRFVDDVGEIIRDIDPRHLITVGTIGGGQCGTAGPEYRRLAESPYLDVLQYHDYGADGVPLPGDAYNGLAVRLRQAQEVGKPLVVTEIGQHAGDSPECASAAQRVDDVTRKIDGQRRAGTAGALLWAFVPDPREAECTFDIGPDDPVRELLARQNRLG